MAQSQGIRIHQYLDDWLIRAPTRESCHHGTQSLLTLCQYLGWVINLQKSELDPSSVRVRGLQIRPLSRTIKTDPSTLGVYPPEDSFHYVQSDMPGQDVYVSHRPSNGNRETSASREPPHETYPVAPEKSMEDSGITGKRDPHSEIPPSPSPMVDQRDKCPSRPISPPHASCSSDLYRRLKRRLGFSLRRLHRKRNLVRSRKPSSHQLSGTKGRFTGTKTFPSSGARKSRPRRHRQHHSCGIHQQGGRYEVRLTLCPSLAPSFVGAT